MIQLLHGENQSASRNRLNEIQEEFVGEKISLDSKEITVEIVSQALTSQSLFGQEKKIVTIENLSGNKELINQLPSPEEGIEVIVWEGKKLTTAQISALEKRLPGISVAEFKIDPVVFKFVESVRPGNQKGLLPLWQKYISSEEPEIVFTMIVRQFRLLLLIKSGASDGPEDYVRLSPWQRKQLDSQAKYFSLDQLKAAYAKLLEIDYQNKTGQSLMDLASSIELFLLRL